MYQTQTSLVKEFDQILIAFLATAYGIFLWMVVAYYCRWLPASLLGQVDEFIFRRPARNWESPPPWQNAVNQSILGFADMQLATGVGILIAAFSTISDLSVYHYQVAIYLAWISSNTHLTAVSLLQAEFRENKTRSLARRLRLGGMAFLSVMLLIALVPTASYNWVALITRNQQHGHAYTILHKSALSSAGVPARCFWQRQYFGHPTPDAAWSFIILIFSYLWKAMLLFESSHRFLKRTCQERMRRSLRIYLDRISSELKDHPLEPSLWLTLKYKVALCLYVAVWALFELAQSFVVSLCICGGGLVWGSLQILVPRHFLPSEILLTESTWTFGQVLPTTLLAVPILAFAEGYMSQKTENTRESRRETPLVDDRPKNQNEDGESTATERHVGPQASKNRMSHHENKRETSANIDNTAGAGDEEQSRAHEQQLPPWRCDARIYSSRFIRSSFWGSQLGILGLGAIFVILYFQLSIPESASNYSKLQVTIATDYGLWFIVGCTVLGWLGMAALLLCAGAMFSSLFKIER
ncbi:MAG: hypothetical protein Q9195_006007 [Heterodermia aff. obscurata]